MATVSIVKLKIRRGRDSERQQIILDSGELGFTIDDYEKRLFVGDGVTYGGIPVTHKVFVADLSVLTSYEKAVVNDFVLDQPTKTLYLITGIDRTTPSFPTYTFEQLAKDTPPDDVYLNLNVTNKLTIKNNSVDHTKISSSSFNQSIAGGNGTPIGVNYDNVKLVILANKLTVSEAGLNLSLLNATTLPVVNPGPGKLWNDAGTVKVGS